MHILRCPGRQCAASEYKGRIQGGDGRLLFPLRPVPTVFRRVLDQWRAKDCASLVKRASVWFGRTLRKKSDLLREHLTLSKKDMGMAKLSKIALGLITELESIRDELGSALDTIEGKGKTDVIHAHGRLTDLAANVTLVVGQFNIKNIVKFIKKRTKLE
jgi:hypothetical protein